MDPWGQDAGLARRCLAGDEGAWREFVERHGPRVFSVCLSSGLLHSEAEDVCQEVMLSALRSLPRYGGCSLSTWLYRITRRRIADHFRSPNRRDVARGFPGDPGFPDKDVDAQGAGDMVPGAVYQELRREFARLPEPTRLVLIAYHVGQVPVREIALDLGMPENTVKSHLRRGRALVRARLEEP